MKTLGLIGAGNMGSALLKGLIQFGGISADNVYVCGHHPEALDALRAELGFTICSSARELIHASDDVLIAVKPYHIEALLSEHFDALKGKNVLSVVAGYGYERLEALVAPETRHLSIMPNTPSAIGEGVLLFEQAHSLTPSDYSRVKMMFESCGRVIELSSHLMGAGGVVSGCGPAFIAMVIEALSDAAVKYGIPRAQAYELVSAMVAGTAKLQQKTGLHPAIIKDGVCSPLGSTIRGVEALERAGLRSALIEAVNAAMRME